MAFAGIILSTAFNTALTFGQKQIGKSFPIPPDIDGIFRTFCYSCHGPDGGRLPHSRLNFALWNNYGPGKQSDKAGAICSSMRKGSMPTKLWKQQNPGLQVKKEQVERICEWAGEIKIDQEKNNHRRPEKRSKTRVE